MKEEEVTVKGVVFLFKVPETLEELRGMCATDEDVLVLASYALSQRMRSTAGSMMRYDVSNEEIASHMQNYIYHAKMKRTKRGKERKKKSKLNTSAEGIEQ
jgi:hypothetical protein